MLMRTLGKVAYAYFQQTDTAHKRETGIDEEEENAFQSHVKHVLRCVYIFVQCIKNAFAFSNIVVL